MTALSVIWAIIWLLSFVTPMVIAISRDHPNVGPIVMINVFAGWTGIGWLVALVWSLMAIDPSKRHRQP